MLAPCSLGCSGTARHDPAPSAPAVTTHPPGWAGPLTTALGTGHSFNAQGIIGATDAAARASSTCDVIMEVVNGAFQRVYPAKAGTFDCNPGNVAAIKMNEN